MGKVKRVLAVGAVAAAIGAMGAAPAQASESAWVPCSSPAIRPICDAVNRQIGNVLTEAEAATDYALYWGDIAIKAVNDTYYTVRCGVLGEC
jgi:hypothetical protein